MTPAAFSIDPNLARGLGRARRLAFGAGVIGLIACLVSAFVNPSQFFISYLFGYLFWLGISLGSLAILMLHYLPSGAWGLVIRRLLESATRNLPLLAVLFVPILAGIPYLYVWAHPGVVAHDEILEHKRPYLNVPFFVARSFLYFASWI